MKTKYHGVPFTVGYRTISRLCRHWYSRHSTGVFVSEKKSRKIGEYGSGLGNSWLYHILTVTREVESFRITLRSVQRVYLCTTAKQEHKNGKREELYRRHYKSKADLMRGIHRFIDSYNNERPHYNIKYRNRNTGIKRKNPH